MGIYLFNEGVGQNKNILGGKGFNLVEMKKLGLPIPNGLIISTKVCTNFFSAKENLNEETILEIKNKISQLEKTTGKTFGGKNPLLVSVRSGAPVSMPGMMDTILNLGINDEVLENFIKITKDENFSYDIYLKFITMFSEIVFGIERKDFEKIEKIEKENKNFSKKILLEKFKNFFYEKTQIHFPTNPYEQLFLAIKSIFKSWNNERAKYYRKLNNISDEMGTAVVVQEMVFGNLNEFSGTGVAFSRNPSNGENEIFGEFLLKAQGEDIVAGIRTPLPISQLKDKLPKIYEEFLKISTLLEKHYKNMQDIEFTIENNKLFILQTRNGKRTPFANVKIIADMVEEKILSKEEGISLINIEEIPQILCGSFLPEELKNKVEITKGLPASMGVACGKAIFSSEKISPNENCILVREETSPEDIKGMATAKGIVTIRGGATSHGAVVARGMGKPCITGCENIKLFEENGYMEIGDLKIKEGDIISIDGQSGKIYLGEMRISKNEVNKDLEKILSWCKEIKNLKVKMNADTPEDILNGIKFGAEGVGLCRTEHMFFQEDKIWAIRKLILSSKNSEKSSETFKEILEFQRKDFVEIFKNLNGLPITVRLLDPPLHEFLPKTEGDIEKLATLLDIEVEEIKNKIAELEEVNPMLGHRGCRLGITSPEIYKIQVQSLLEAGLICEEEGITVNLEIMLPLIFSTEEFKFIKEYILQISNEIFEKAKRKFDFKIGTMLELPRACLIADELADECDFFSFGTNDLTQTTLGLSRDDSTKFISPYREKNILSKDPFQTLDTNGVGKLISLASNNIKLKDKNLSVGVCGEHGGDPLSLEFFKNIDLDYVSCSPFRIPTAIIKLAQLNI